jgi:hypothetical protein
MVVSRTIKVQLGPLLCSSGCMPFTSAIRKHMIFQSSCLGVTDCICRWGPVAWIIISEVFPLGLRAKGVSIGGSSNWLNNVRHEHHVRLGKSEANVHTVRGRPLDFALHRCVTVWCIRKPK